MEKILLWPEMEIANTGNPADDFAPFLETYLLDNCTAPRGAVLVCPGGGYHHRAIHEAGPIAQRFNALGFHAFVVQYRVSPYVHPAPLKDALRAMRIIRKHAEEWKVIPDQIAILGFSAGGHLAGTAAVLSNSVSLNVGDELDDIPARPDAMVLCYPVIHVTDDYGHVGSGEYLLGAAYSAQAAAALNIDKYVDSSTQPAFIWHTADDSVVNIRNSTEFAAALWKNGVSAELHVFPHGRHGLGLAPEFKDISQWPEQAAIFLTNTCNFSAESSRK